MRTTDPSPVERVRDEHPDSAEWRGDAMAASRHSRLLDELRLPRAAADPEAAARLTAEVCRNALRDLAPGLILLPAEERHRAQALAAYVLVLFDFARQSGLEGERLAQINRCQFQLEEALSGATTGQPIFLRLAVEQQRRPWNRSALDGLADAARHRVTVQRPATPEARAAEIERLAAALTAALLGSELQAPTRLASGLLRLFSLLDLAEGLRRHDARLPRSELPDAWSTSDDVDRDQLASAVRRECSRARDLLRPPRRDELPRVWQRVAKFLALAGGRLLDDVARIGAEVVERAPQLGIGARLVLLLRSRWP